MNTGKILLVPISSPREGMKCVWKEKKIGIITSNEPVNVDMVEFEGEAVDEDDLKQIMIEYEKEWLPRELLNEGEQLYMTKETLPLHPSDWEYGLGHIGSEIELDQVWLTDGISRPVEDEGVKKDYKGTWYAKLILPSKEKSIVYNEKEAYDICLSAAAVTKMMCAKNEMWSFDDWWGQNKKK